MRRALAIARIKWHTARSYRLHLVLSFAGLLVSIVPLYFVGRALDPVMAPKIHAEGGEFFGFLLVGMVMLPFVNVALQTLPGEIQGGVSSGTLESMLATPIRLPALLAGLSGYELAWTAVRAAVVLAAGAVLGVHVAPQRLASLLLIVGFVVLAYLPIGLLASALVLWFRTPAEVPRLALYASIVLGGVYYPTGVIPESVRGFASVIPLTYGLRAARRVALQDAPLSAVAGDLGTLAAFAVVLGAGGAFALVSALRHTRRTGTLGF